MEQQTRKTLYIIILSLLAMLLAACNGESTYPSGPIPTPRDVTSSVELSTELAHLRITWTVDQVEGQSVALINLDGTNPQPISLPEYAVTPSLSPTTQYAVYVTTLLPEADIEMLDLQTQERRILVEGKERFPGASLLNPSFSPDEALVIFEVNWNNRIDLAIVDLTNGKVQYLELGGGFNMWPEVSPDGKWILVACEHETQPGFGLCLLDQSQHIRRYLADDVVSRSGEFSPDSQMVAYIAMVGGVMGEGQLYRVDIDSDNRLRLVSGLYPGEDILGLTAEDVVFTCTYPGEPACSWVCVIGLDGNDVRRLTYLGERCIDVDAP
jgi:Tol biopolymer transport system component